MKNKQAIIKNKLFNLRVWLALLIAFSGLMCLLKLPVVQASTQAAPPNAVADRVLGQTGFSGQGFGLSASQMNGPAGIAIAPPGAPNAGRIFVVEYTNFRVLSWPSATSFANGAAADLVLGQPNFSSNTGGLEAFMFYGPEAAVVDTSGNLYVADTENNRVLQFRPPFSNGMNASIVFGQPNFVTPNNQNNQGGSVAANTLFFPRGLALDSAGNLFVTDSFNNRVLRYSPPFATNMTASLVLGQPNFTSNGLAAHAPEAAATLNEPKAVTVDSAGNVYVADYGNHRVLRYAPPLSNGMNASKVFGQPDFTTGTANNGGRSASSLNGPVDLVVSAAGDTLFVTDQINTRVLAYTNPATGDAVADAVYGQPNYTSATANSGGVSATSLNQEPLGVALDANGSLYVADFQNNRVLAFDNSAPPPTATTSPTGPPPPTATQTPIPTATNTPAVSPTSTPINPTATNTPVVLPTFTPTLPTTAGDEFEGDDSCPIAKAIGSDGTVQLHTFHKQADADWARFDAVVGTTYVVQGQVGAGSSADLTLEVFPSCNDLPQAQNFAFSPGVRLEFTANATGPVYLKWTNATASVFGSTARYNVNVTARSNTPPAGAVIIVAGRLKNDDPLQPNIHNVTNLVYEAFTKRGYATDKIKYLATDLSMPGVSGLPTQLNVQNAITTWAKQRLANNQSLTLYLMDHGDPDIFYLDNTSSQTMTTQMLNTWVNELEGQFTDLKINIVVDACYSGSFITEPDSLSKPGRVIAASTTADRVAFVSPNGSIFSDHFVAALSQGQSLFDAFSRARWSTQIAYPLQGPQLDDDGDKQANTLNDGLTAQRRGFSFANTLASPNFAPFIQKTDVRPSAQPNRREIRATILDDVKVKTAYAVIYPPSYVAPTAQTELAKESLESVLLADAGNNTFTGLYSGFTEGGRYRLVIYARDDKDEPAQPVELFVQNGSKVYMPMIIRQVT